jgi:CMP-N-acetylneuraminic acid synthetase
MSNIYAVSTARGGSKSVPNKNVMMINSKPLYLHNLLESIATAEIKATYISTDIEEVIQNASTYGYKVIIRPPELCQDASTHTETIYHALLAIEENVSEQVDVLVVMLGNTINMDRKVITQAIEMLTQDPELDSVITVIRANHFNPIRAYVDDGTGYITTYLTQDLIKEKTSRMHLSDKNSCGNILFQNGLWIIRRRAIIKAQEQRQGLLPFQWFGDKIRYIEQDPRLQEIDDIYQVRLLEDK